MQRQLPQTFLRANEQRIKINYTIHSRKKGNSNIKRLLGVQLQAAQKDCLQCDCKQSKTVRFVP